MNENPYICPVCGAENGEYNLVFFSRTSMGKVVGCEHCIKEVYDDLFEKWKNDLVCVKDEDGKIKYYEFIGEEKDLKDEYNYRFERWEHENTRVSDFGHEF